MSADAIEIFTNAIHTAFIKCPEGDGGPNLDYEWIVPIKAYTSPRPSFRIGRPTDIRS
jgi:hypothetical protein